MQPSAVNLANAITIAGALCTCYNIVYHPQTPSALLIFAAAFCDTIDGPVARHFKTAGPVGAMLDDIGDALGWVIYPATVLYHTSGVYPVTIFIYVVAGLLRLYGFYTKFFPMSEKGDYFSGLATPHAAYVIFGLSGANMCASTWSQALIVLLSVAFLSKNLWTPKQLLFVGDIDCLLMLPMFAFLPL